MATTLLLSAADVRAVFDMPAAIASQHTAFFALGNGAARLAPRLLIEGDADGSVAFCYAARLSNETGPVCKFGSVNPNNASASLPLVSALVVVLDPVTGAPAALIEGSSLTELRTAAATAVAAKHLVAEGARRLTVFGCGVQGEAHVRALSSVLTLDCVEMWSPNQEERLAVAERLNKEFRFEVLAADDPKLSVRSADVVVTCTTSAKPVVRTKWLKDGCTVLSVGSFAPDRCETDMALLSRASLVVVDDIATACEQAGPIVAGLREGLITEQELISLGEVVVNAVSRQSATDIIYYNSVGIGVQDAAAAWGVIEAARLAGVGTGFAF